jgi:hypothetical protein
MVSDNCGFSTGNKHPVSRFLSKIHKTPAIISQYVGNVFPEAGLRDVGFYSHATIVLDV